MSMRLAYVGVEDQRPDRWSDFADIVGLQPVAHPDALCLRMDERARRFIITEGAADDFAFAGFEVDDRAAFDAAVDRVKQAGAEVEEGTAAGAALRAVDHYVSFRDPTGVQHEIAIGCAVADTPFDPKFPNEGFVTGEEGMGHVAINSHDYAACEKFFAKAMGAGLSDHIFSDFGDSQVQVAFMHLNPRHHSVAYAQFPFETTRRIDHVMVEMVDIVDVLKIQARVVEADIPITITLGEHPNDHAISFYCTSPCGFRLEFASRCIKVDPATWTPSVYDYFSMWGHRVAG